MSKQNTEKQGRYKLICMTFDGDYITERDRFTSSFATIADAWQHANDMGSKWFFYPFYFVTSGDTIRDTPDLLHWLKGKKIATVKRLFSEFNEASKGATLDADEYAARLGDFDRVILRQWQDADGSTGIDAFLPDAEVNPGMIMCYAHIGQHSEASLAYYQSTRPADPTTPDAQALIAELRGIGYVPRLVKRLSRPFGGWAT